jgi:aspartyl-tRNA(Asn)/glutamyl-tRNA(Gln) amidotransferase subunit C
MGVPIDEAQVRHIAKLARLNLSDDEVRLFSRQLADILNHFRQLEAIDTEGVEPLEHPSALTDVARDDELGECFDAETALANAPEREGLFFRTPPVIDQSTTDA